MLHQPAECARSVCSATRNIRNSPIPQALWRERGTAVVSLSNLISPPLTFSIAHVPATWEVKTENEGQMGEANENFSILFLSLERENRNPLMIALLTENVVEIIPKHPYYYYYLSSKITLNSSIHNVLVVGV